MVPRLEFVSTSERFAKNVGRSLLSHKAPVLESLHMKIRNECDDIYLGDIGAWIGIAFARHVREFVLDVYNSFGEPLLFLSSLFCCDTLVTLKLKKSIYIDVPCPVSMKSLRILHLESVTYCKDNESICNLLSGCPNLEELVVHRGDSSYGKNFVIVVPSLKRLSINDSASGWSDGRYVINAPCLEYLKIERLKGYEICLIENVPELVEANIRDVSKTSSENILGSLKSAKRLSLDLSTFEIKCPSGAIFYQLVCLEMYTHRAKWWNLLTLMLDSSPKLQVLKLVDCWSHEQHLDYGWNPYLVGEKWSEPKYVPQCLLSHLEAFVWTRCDWRKEEERKVAAYILRNAIRLKKATFSIRPIEKLKELEKRLEMLKVLNGVVRGSNSCQLVFEFE
ncbi:F-box/FBD/LRR-repeat protein [Cardamine amara subsp. amara]|uniref:F-box/FBD/LRR-repeat protein n=1 Tax=Cardamine amara subsp. amara TaxID=228776 RepID=A0ABD0ZNX6_CARAN